MLFKILAAIESATGIKPVPFLTSNINSAIVYNWRVLSDTGSVAQALLEVRIIDKSMSRVDEINNQIKGALLKFGDGSPVEGIIQANTSGESFLPLDDVIQKITNINLKYRSEVI